MIINKDFRDNDGQINEQKNENINNTKLNNINTKKKNKKSCC